MKKFLTRTSSLFFEKLPLDTLKSKLIKLLTNAPLKFEQEAISQLKKAMTFYELILQLQPIEKLIYQTINAHAKDFNQDPEKNIYEHPIAETIKDFLELIKNINLLLFQQSKSWILESSPESIRSFALCDLARSHDHFDTI